MLPVRVISVGHVIRTIWVYSGRGSVSFTLQVPLMNDIVLALFEIGLFMEISLPAFI